MTLFVCIQLPTSAKETDDVLHYGEPSAARFRSEAKSNQGRKESGLAPSQLIIESEENAEEI